MVGSRKFKKGDSVNYHGQRWVVCEGGYSDPYNKQYRYKIRRGAKMTFVRGGRLARHAG